MVKRNAHLDDDAAGAAIDERRLASLANLQTMMLKHALRMPQLRRLVYSTCSIHERENEAVIDEVLADAEFHQRFQLVNALPRWKNRGHGNNVLQAHVALRCLRADPNADRTNGFFVAVFEARK